MMGPDKLMTNPLDRIISQSVKDVLEEDLGLRTYKKIEEEMHDTLGISMLEASQDFKKLDLVLRKFLGITLQRLKKEYSEK